jgi:hypothetical protein
MSAGPAVGGVPAPAAGVSCCCRDKASCGEHRLPDQLVVPAGADVQVVGPSEEEVDGDRIAVGMLPR